VIRDILPLYIESISSDDTNAMVEEHIRSCDNCRKKLDEMNAIDHIPLDTDTGPLRTLKATLRKKKIQTIVLSVMMTVVLAVTVIAFLTTPAYIPYREGLVSITEDDNGNLYGLEAITKEQFNEHKRIYSPYGSVASIYLWKISSE